MKRVVIVGCAAGFSLALAGLLWAQSKPKTMSVQVKESHLRDKPSFLGGVLGSVKYTDSVLVLEEQPDWYKVQKEGAASGWLHVSAVSPKKITMDPGAAQARTTASGEEIVLAGKGFNAQVEDKYRQQSRLDFRWIDTMEKTTVSPADITKFIEAGGLRLGKGGGQ